jgi:hypothetical protein
MLKTVPPVASSASVMTAVDVHGTVDGPIFADTASSFTIMNGEGEEKTIDASFRWQRMVVLAVRAGFAGWSRDRDQTVPRRCLVRTRQHSKARSKLPVQRKAALSARSKACLLALEARPHGVFYTPYAAAPNLPSCRVENSLCCPGCRYNPDKKISTSVTRDRLLSGEFG